MFKRPGDNDYFQASKRIKGSQDFYGNRNDRTVLPKEDSLNPPNQSNNQTDFRNILTNKPDGKDKPLYVLPSGLIFVEAFLPMYQQAEDFLVLIAEPVSRQRYCHQYQITAYSLYAGASMGISTDKIIETLDKFCKTNLPNEIVDFIKQCTTSYGQLNVILKNSKYFLESSSPEIMKKLMNDGEIRACLLSNSDSMSLLNQRIYNHEYRNANVQKEQNEFDDIHNNLDDEDNDDAAYKKQSNAIVPVSFEVANIKLEQLQKRCMDLGFNPLSEYDFKHDTKNENINIRLKPHATLRPYQEKSLSRMFGSGRARSGIIVLPCGAGKTLTGVAATCTINKKCLILCTSSVAVEQWKNQFKYWSDADNKKVCRLTKDAKDNPKNSSILISTYSMITHSAKRSREAEEVMKWIRGIEWGLMILDEVQFAPANEFRKVISDVHAHCKLGLTATLVREDNKISDLNFLIGPKLYEANWLQLQDKGYIAKVQCCEVACRMDPMFYKEYLETSSKPLQQTLFVMNPEKFRICQFLIEYHEERKDKIIVFVDNLIPLELYAKSLRRPFLCGYVSDSERMNILENFKRNENCNTIFVSKVADNSIDLPDANVLIQISNVAGSRRQESQRLGRILRAKKGSNNEEINAFFYSLVSQDTAEIRFAHKRQRFLVQQGYSYKFINRLPGMEKATLEFSTEIEKMDLLKTILEKPINELKKDDSGDRSSKSKSSFQSSNRTTGQNKSTNNPMASNTPSAPQATKSQQNQPDISRIAGIASDLMKKPEPKQKNPHKPVSKRHTLFTRLRK